MYEKQPDTGALAPMYYIQNRFPVGNCVIWWREGGQEYTCNIDEAGKFPEDKAASIVRDRPDIDTAWRCEDVDSVVVRHVDCQSLREFKRLLPRNRTSIGNTGALQTGADGR